MAGRQRRTWHRDWFGGRRVERSGPWLRGRVRAVRRAEGRRRKHGAAGPAGCGSCPGAGGRGGSRLARAGGRSRPGFRPRPPPRGRPRAGRGDAVRRGGGRQGHARGAAAAAGQPARR
eukprot:5750929-Pyramimonas_sp.AAC.1